MTSTATATCFYHLYRGLLQYSPNLYLCVNLRLSHSFVQNSPVGFHLTLNNSQNPYNVHKDLYDLPPPIPLTPTLHLTSLTSFPTNLRSRFGGLLPLPSPEGRYPHGLLLYFLEDFAKL